MVKAVSGVDALRAELGNLLTKEQEVRLEIVRAIAVNYMKPSTATLDESIVADAVLKAKRLKAAVEAAYGIVVG